MELPDPDGVGEALQLNLVHNMREETVPEGAERLEWFLLTSLAVECQRDAERVMEWYRLRWRIEDWHRVLKTGCEVEHLGHRRRERIERAVLTLAMLGGYLNYKHKQYAVPGHKVMWEGYTRLVTITQVVERTRRLNEGSKLYQKMRSA